METILYFIGIVVRVLYYKYECSICECESNLNICIGIVIFWPFEKKTWDMRNISFVNICRYMFIFLKKRIKIKNNCRYGWWRDSLLKKYLRGWWWHYPLLQISELAQKNNIPYRVTSDCVVWWRRGYARGLR